MNRLSSPKTASPHISRGEIKVLGFVIKVPDWEGRATRHAAGGRFREAGFVATTTNKNLIFLSAAFPIPSPFRRCQCQYLRPISRTTLSTSRRQTIRFRTHQKQVYIVTARISQTCSRWISCLKVTPQR